MFDEGFGALVLAIYVSFVVVLTITAFLILYLQRLKKDILMVKKDVTASIDQEITELKMDILIIIESELEKLRKEIPAELNEKLRIFKNGISKRIDSEIGAIKDEINKNMETKQIVQSKNLSGSITALVDALKNLSIQK